MIKLTALYYKVKTEALERFHDINEHGETLIYEWEKELEKARDLGTEYPSKPFIEPFEFEDDDYDVTEQPFRIRLSDIQSVKTNLDGIVEITVSPDKIYSVKETIEEVDKLFGI